MWWSVMVLLIFQWNARSLIANGQEFKKFISDLGKKPDIICVQETWLKPQLNFVLQGYEVIRKDKKQGIGGGIATFIKQGVGYRNVEESGDKGVVVMEVWEGSRIKKVIWCGDFNAHNTLWGSFKTDYNGLIVEEMLDWGQLVCINNGCFTRIDVTHGRKSALDITLVSEILARKCECNASKQSTMGSDHYPIWCKIGVDITQTLLFKELCHNNMCEMVDDIEGIEELSKKISEMLRNTAEEVIGKKKTINSKKAVPWERNKAMKKARKSVLFNEYINFKRAQAIVRREVRKAKRNYWREFRNRIGEEIEINEVWNMIRKMGGIQRNNNIPVLVNNGKIAIKDRDKAEMLVETFVKVHSNENISENMRKYREQKVRENAHIYVKKNPSESMLDSEFTLYELKRVLVGVKYTSPGKDDICYEMIKHLSELSLSMILRLFNKIWETGNLPADWRHGVIVPIAKPGKDHSQPINYRPIALTSNLCKIMERMKMEKYVGFNTVVCLEAEIRKAQVNKEVLVGVFFDVEKAYDMLWKERLLLKLESLRIDGKMYNWILSFLFGRTIQVRVGTAFSQILPIENGTPQGSILGRSLYADDGALWKRGWKNGRIVGVFVFVAKTQVICFSKKKKNPRLNVKMYGYQLEQVNVVRFWGMWMDSKLSFKIHIQKLIEKCKKGINVLRCLSGAEWGASCQSLKIIYYAVIRSNIDYGCVVYSSANKTLLKKIEVIQNQALRICCGAFRSSPVASLQVEMGELPLEQRRSQLRLRYWYGVKGHLENHPVRVILKNCWEYEYKEITSFGWVVRKEVNSLELKDYEIAPSVAIPAIPPWLFPMPLIDLQIHKIMKEPEMNIPTKLVVQQYIIKEYYSVLQVFTDGSKEPELSEHVSVFTTELLATMLALQWIEEVQPERTVICSDSMAVLTSLLSGKSEARQDLVFEVLQSLFRIRQLGIEVNFLWVPAYVGGGGQRLIYGGLGHHWPPLAPPLVVDTKLFIQCALPF
ncbi:hypothetical protein IRJ41_016520 [Triplophysa rosa]|uniref:Reverse transcriptase domain-containing protein n=1 Tax=Triplophysa rosa TaxID=992332 RepID=A0A9W8C612_TRIRA|nr:hypothetical protein IRJ41_016520 [Triplophysa rosa]